MKINARQLNLYAVTDRSWLKPGETLVSVTEELLKAGVTCVQLREKHMSDEEILTEASLLKDLCDRYQVPLIINDRVQVALDAGADGVHLGQEDMSPREARAILGPDAIIGVSARTVGSAQRAEQEGADYLGVGAAFTTSSKPEAGHIDAETIRAICETVKIPVIAIGGIKEENLLQLRGNGLCGVAVISAIFAQKDIEAATRRLHALAEEMAGDQE